MYTLKIAELIEESLTNVNDTQFILNFNQTQLLLGLFLM